MNTTNQYYAGLDMGSVSIKAVIICNQKITGWALIPSGGNYKTAATTVMTRALAAAKIHMDDLCGIGVTGLGAQSTPFDARPMSDISCQAKGCHIFFPSARTLIDIGGQFTKTAKITDKGKIADFLMSEKCATGSGRFLQVISRILQVPIEEIGELSLTSQHPIKFSTNCAVFAESETISRIAEGAKPADILAGVHKAMASKVNMLLKRITLAPDVVLTGGGGEDAGLAKAIGQIIGHPILVPPNPRLTAAFGAACLTMETTSN